MGELFVAELEGAADFRKLVVIKRLLPHLSENPEFEALFFNEARIAARLSHPNVCHVYELDRAADQYYIAMEYLEGASLGELCNDHGAGRLAGAWSVTLVASLFYQFCEGLHHVHELRSPDGEPLGIVHRDISPANLFVTTSGVGKVLDFGIAKIRAAVRKERSSLKGKFAYMSPEQLRGEPLDRRSDVFALGIVLFEALTGQPMFDLPSDMLVAQAIMDGAIRVPGELRPDVPAALDAVLRRALAPAPGARFGSARELGDAVLDAIGGAVLPPGRIAGALGPAMARYLSRRGGALDGLGVDRPAAAGTSRRAASGSDRTAGLPEIEVTSGRSAEPASASALAPASAAPASASAAPERRGRRAGIVVGVAVLAVAAGAAVWIGWGREPAPAVAPAAAPAPVVAAAPPAAVPAPASPAVAEPAPSPSPSSSSPPAPSPPPPQQQVAGSAPAPRPGRRKPASAAPPRPPAPPPARAADQPPGFLSIASTPFSTIYVDGKKIGDTPIYKLSLAPGPHSVRAVAGDRAKTLEVTVRSGEVATQRIDW